MIFSCASEVDAATANFTPASGEQAGWKARLLFRKIRSNERCRAADALSGNKG